MFRRLTLRTQRKHSLRDFNRCEIALSPNAKLSLQMYQSSVHKRNDCATPVRRLGLHGGCATELYNKWNGNASLRVTGE